MWVISSSPQLNAFSKKDGEMIIDQDGNRIKQISRIQHNGAYTKYISFKLIISKT